MIRLAYVLFAAVLFALNLGATSASANVQQCFDKHRGVTLEQGRTYPMYASWYGNQFHGRPTASGITFDETNPRYVAHKVLPLGTKIAIYNPETKVTREATVVDDGPHPEGRDLDASKALAEALGFKHAGKTWLEVTIIKMSDDECRDDGKGLR